MREMMESVGEVDAEAVTSGCNAYAGPRRRWMRTGGLRGEVCSCAVCERFVKIISMFKPLIFLSYIIFLNKKE